MLTFLDETAERFDLILAADTLVYLGNLEDFFRAAALTTRPGAHPRVQHRDHHDRALYGPALGPLRA